MVVHVARVNAPVLDPTDEGEQVMLTMVRLLRHRQTKGAVTDILDLRDAEPVLYST